MQAFMKHSPTPIIDRPEIFDLLAGSSELRTMLQDGLPASEIVASWAADVAEFKALRASYLRY
jgi:uncharacterized protein YbbC (DUF1343 family)